MAERKVSRRDFLALTGLASAGIMLSSCQPKVVEKIVKETVVVEKKVEVQKEVTKVVEKQVGLKQVPRERTLAVCYGGSAGAWATTGIAGPYCTGYTHQDGGAIMLEPLFFYSWFSGQLTPWIGESYQYNADYTELVVKIRKGVEWSDGVPFTARDVVFTLNMLIKNAPLLGNSAMVKDAVKEATAVDDFTVKIVFNRPSPRFFHERMTSKGDVGTYWVPEHVYKNVEDPTTFRWFDPEKGEPLTTGPYKLTLWTSTQKFFDRRDDWWGAKIGFAPLPQVERILYIPMSDETMAAQLAISNVIDTTFHLRAATLKNIVEQGPTWIAHSGKKAPYGYIDYWPTVMGFNDLEPPYSDPDLRWAVNCAINRDQAIEVGLGGCGKPAYLPIPGWPVMQPFFDSIKDLLAKYNTIAYDPAKSESLVKGKGYVKDKEGIWTKDGKRLRLEIVSIAFLADIGPVVAEQLRKAGFEASFITPADAGDRIALGKADAFIWGIGTCTAADPYPLLGQFVHSEIVKTGESGWNNPYRWGTPEFTEVLKEMNMAPIGSQKLIEVFHKAMEIWLPQLPFLSLTEFYHHIGMNTLYWTNWPTEENAYVNGASWHLTWPFLVHHLKAAK